MLAINLILRLLWRGGKYRFLHDTDMNSWTDNKHSKSAHMLYYSCRKMDYCFLMSSQAEWEMVKKQETFGVERERGWVQDIWRDNRAGIKQQINKSILAALSFCAATVLWKVLTGRNRLCGNQGISVANNCCLIHPSVTPTLHQWAVDPASPANKTFQSTRVPVSINVCVCTFCLVTKLMQ